MSEQHNYHIKPEEFRQYGKQVIDWIADYYEQVESYPVLPHIEPGAIRAKLPTHAPQTGEPFADVLRDVNDIILPGVTHWQSPNFFAFFPSNTSGPSILGELLSAGLGQQGMMWLTSPACTELETRVMDWLAEMLALPEQFHSTASGGGVIQDSASGAALCAILAARERATDFKTNLQGGDGKLVAYISTQTHSSLEKAVKIAGIGSANLCQIAVDERFAMRPDALLEQIRRDREAGLTPFFVCATVGTTSSNAMDPLPEIGRICRQEGVWLHVDGAMSGTAAICPEYRHFLNGIEYADSFCFNPHKWLFTNFDCDCFFVADRAVLINTLSILPEYLRNKATESGAVIDYRDWQISLGRRFRALKLWFVIRHYGVQGLQYHIRRHIQLAQQFVEWVKESADFELAAPAPLNLVCFRYKGDDDANKTLLERLNTSGRVYLSHTVLDGRFTLRMCVGQTHTEERHVRAAWELIQKTGRELSK